MNELGPETLRGSESGELALCSRINPSTCEIEACDTLSFASCPRRDLSWASFKNGSVRVDVSFVFLSRCILSRSIFWNLHCDLVSFDFARFDDGDRFGSRNTVRGLTENALLGFGSPNNYNGGAIDFDDLFDGECEARSPVAGSTSLDCWAEDFLSLVPQTPTPSNVDGGVSIIESNELPSPSCIDVGGSRECDRKYSLSMRRHCWINASMWAEC
ncbi:unnamed protein product [Linum trigynum]|uniref:Uncharacterized protein n=1 Tax=Linum trigynum TaxID=586398 RepID=A0AAV2GPX0_9ROSI